MKIIISRRNKGGWEDNIKIDNRIRAIAFPSFILEEGNRSGFQNVVFVIRFVL